MAFHLYSRGKTSGVFAQNVEIFTPDLLPDIRNNFDAIWNISIINTTASTYEYTLDSGSNWFPLGTVVVDEEFIANIKAHTGDLFNLRITDGGGGTAFRIVVSIAPEDIIRALMPVTVKSPLDVTITGQPISVTETADPKDVAITGQPITVTQSANPLPVKGVAVLLDDISALARAIDQEWFASDITPAVAVGFSSDLLFTFCYSVKAIFEISLDSGVTWCQLDGGNDIDANTINNFFIPVINGDLVNFRADVAGTVHYARVSETGA